MISSKLIMILVSAFVAESQVADFTELMLDADIQVQLLKSQNEGIVNWRKIT